MDRAGELNRLGFPKPVPGARVILDYVDDTHAAFPSPRVQRAAARGILRIADLASNEYVFVDEWDVDAPIDAVHAAVGNAGTYPEWWRPTYLDVRTEGEPGVGQVNHHHFRGPLPYTLKATTRTTRYEPPTLVETDVTGDLRGTGIWTLTPTPSGGTHVRFDWRVAADRPFLRVLTPVAAPGVPVEPRMGDRARHGGTGAVREAPRRRGAAARCGGRGGGDGTVTRRRLGCWPCHTERSTPGSWTWTACSCTRSSRSPARRSSSAR